MKISLQNFSNIDLHIPDGVFKPTETSNLLVESVLETIKSPLKILDLGAGSGIVGIILGKSKIVKFPLYASDLSKESINAIQINCDRNNIPVEVRKGSLFTPWIGECFDCIINDISGISESVASISPWFDNISCSSGVDGSDLTISVLANANKYLHPKGSVFFPVISFSNTEKIIEFAKRNFNEVMLIKRREWPLPKTMYKNIALLKELKDKGYIDFKESFGMVICYTEIYCAKL